jgi:FkbM family methyltransferase
VRETLINGRWSLLLPEHRAVRPEWPAWEQERLAHMHSILGEGGHVIYDIGAEEGDLPALWASWGNDVALFEPNDRVWPNIKAIWDANSLPGPLAAFRGFAAETDDNAMWRLSGAWPECAEGPLIGDHGFCNLCERPDIPRVRIDSISTSISPPTAITIDVEGAELRVLRGARRVLNRHRPHVWVSVHPAFMADMYADTPDNLFAYMDSVGYDRQHLATDHEEHWYFSPRSPG